MSVITIFSGSYCHADVIANRLFKDLRSGYVEEKELLIETSKRLGVSEKKLEKALYRGPSIFNDFTHEKERAFANIGLDLAVCVARGSVVYHGFSAHLVPRDIPDVLRVCLTAEAGVRAQRMAEARGVAEKEASKLIQAYDDEAETLTKYLFRKSPWDASLYDLTIETDKVTIETAIETIINRAEALPAAEPHRAVEDFLLASRVNLALIGGGHALKVSCRDATVAVVIDRGVIRLQKLKEDIEKTVMAVEGVKGVRVEVSPEVQKGLYYKVFRADMPARVLLVDDDREFVEILANALRRQDIGAVSVFGGAEALSVVEEEEPAIMVLDLNMPGMKGIDVLKSVKNSRPEIEIIVLTGHGSGQDRLEAESHGAFSYLEKPVDMELLVSTVMDAHRKHLK
jgi:CheY-like chemotaxis protein/cytidylate kinase